MSVEERRTISPHRDDFDDDDNRYGGDDDEQPMETYDSTMSNTNRSQVTTRHFKFFNLFQTSTTDINNARKRVHLWFSYYYLIDWVLAATIIVTSQIVFGTVGFVTPYQRYATYWYMNDASIAYPDSASIVPTWALIIFVFCVPTIIFALVQIRQKSAHDFHHALLGIFITEMLTMLFTDAFKAYAGRLRPDFLARCRPDITGSCTNANLNDVKDGRLSFPSGHSSTSFAAMVFLSCYLFGKFKIFHVNGGQLWKVMIAISPIFLSGFIAISRTRDYHHNFDDILAGSFLGTAMGLIGYHLNYPSLFSDECHLPKNRYFIHAEEMRKRQKQTSV